MIAGSNGMRQEQTEPSGNSISDGNKYSAPARKSNGAQRRTLGNIVFPVEKMLVSKVLRAFGNPPVERPEDFQPQWERGRERPVSRPRRAI
jgi:hypothetical protein